MIVITESFSHAHGLECLPLRRWRSDNRFPTQPLIEGQSPLNSTYSERSVSRHWYTLSTHVICTHFHKVYESALWRVDHQLEVVTGDVMRIPTPFVRPCHAECYQVFLRAHTPNNINLKMKVLER